MKKTISVLIALTLAACTTAPSTTTVVIPCGVSTGPMTTKPGGGTPLAMPKGECGRVTVAVVDGPQAIPNPFIGGDGGL